MLEEKRAVKIKKTVTFEPALFMAAEELVKRLQDSGAFGEIGIDMDTFIQSAVARELRRREVTWWETRVSKALRIVSGVQLK